jgi:zinc transporter
MSTGERIESPGDLIAHLCRNLLDRMEAVVIDLADRVDELEESVLTTQSDKVRVELGSIRHRAVLLRRYVAPQRDAIEQLANLQIEYLGPGSRNLLMEAANRVTRYAEELDSIRDGCGLVQDDLETRLNFQINRTIYHLSVVAGIFLPLALLRVFSVSMSAEFLAKKKWRFWLVCGALALVAVFEIWFFPSPQMVVGQ